MITIVDYGMGNLGSIVNMLRKIGVDSQVTSRPDILLASERIILPGVGSFDAGMNNLAKLGLIEVLDEIVIVHERPILGLCLGMQLFTKNSEEGSREGLGWIDGRTVRFNFDECAANLKVPHMGWSTVDVLNTHYLFQYSGDQEPKFYFAHAYHVVTENKADVLAETEYGYPFTAAIQNNNIMGVQFHPEKSHRHGLQLLRNFAECQRDEIGSRGVS